MTRLTQFPTIELVTETEVERFRKKLEKAQAAVEIEKFWEAVQAKKQPRRPIDYAELGALW